VLDVARGLLADAEPLVAERGLTLLGLAVSGLADDRPLQMALPFGPRDDGELDATLDRLHDRFGAGSVTRATLMGRNHGPTVPLLPD
jgi:DNA polymerase-4